MNSQEVLALFFMWPLQQSSQHGAIITQRGFSWHQPAEEKLLSEVAALSLFIKTLLVVHGCHRRDHGL